MLRSSCRYFSNERAPRQSHFFAGSGDHMSKYKTSRQIADDVQALICYDVTQRDLAKTLGISTAYLSDFLAGKRGAGPTILKALGYEIEPVYRRSPQVSVQPEGSK